MVASLLRALVGIKSITADSWCCCSCRHVRWRTRLQITLPEQDRLTRAGHLRGETHTSERSFVELNIVELSKQGLFCEQTFLEQRGVLVALIKPSMVQRVAKTLSHALRLGGLHDDKRIDLSESLLTRHDLLLTIAIEGLLLRGVGVTKRVLDECSRVVALRIVLGAAFSPSAGGLVRASHLTEAVFELLEVSDSALFGMRLVESRRPHISKCFGTLHHVLAGIVVFGLHELVNL